MHASENKLSKDFKNGNEISVGQAVLSYGSNSQNNVLINNSRTALSYLINFNAIFEFHGQFTIRALAKIAYIGKKQDGARNPPCFLTGEESDRNPPSLFSVCKQSGNN